MDGIAGFENTVGSVSGQLLETATGKGNGHLFPLSSGRGALSQTQEIVYSLLPSYVFGCGKPLRALASPTVNTVVTPNLKHMDIFSWESSCFQASEAQLVVYTNTLNEKKSELLPVKAFNIRVGR